MAEYADITDNQIRLNQLAQSPPRGTKVLGCAAKNENFVSECWIAGGSDVARQARHDGNFQGAGQRAGDVAHVKPGRRSSNRSDCPRRREQVGLCLPLGALPVLASFFATTRSALVTVWQKFPAR